MQIETINEIFTEAVSKAVKVAVKNPQNPILEYIYIEIVDESTIEISGYNLDTYIKQQVFVKISDFTSKKTSICVQGGLVLSFLALFNKEDKISLHISESNLKITVNNQE